MTPKQRAAYITAIKNFNPSTEYWEKVDSDLKEMEEYMKLPNHTGNCHCYRCMAEFINKRPRNDNE